MRHWYRGGHPTDRLDRAAVWSLGRVHARYRCDTTSFPCRTTFTDRITPLLDGAELDQGELPRVSDLECGVLTDLIEVRLPPVVHVLTNHEARPEGRMRNTRPRTVVSHMSRIAVLALRRRSAITASVMATRTT
jgi:hypothetical protein